jgi:copper chaperone CopZ
MKYIPLLLSLIFLSFPAHAIHSGTPHDMVIKVNGLVCDFCARTVEKTLGARAEIGGVHVDLDAHEILVEFKDKADIKDDDITKMIVDAGYSVTEIKRDKKL